MVRHRSEDFTYFYDNFSDLLNYSEQILWVVEKEMESFSWKITVGYVTYNTLANTDEKDPERAIKTLKHTPPMNLPQ